MTDSGSSSVRSTTSDPLFWSFASALHRAEGPNFYAQHLVILMYILISLTNRYILNIFVGQRQRTQHLRDIYGFY